MDSRLSQNAHQIFVRWLLSAKVRVHEVVIIFHDGLNQLRSPFLCLIHIGRWDLRLFNNLTEFVLIDERLHFQKINNADKVTLQTDRQLNRVRFFGETCANGLQVLHKIRPRAIELVDKAHARHMIFVRLAPHGLRLRLHSGHAVKHDDAAV